MCIFQDIKYFKLKVLILLFIFYAESLFLMPRRRTDEEDYEGKILDTVPKDYYKISKGTVGIYDKTTKEMVLVVRFNPFELMVEETKNDFNHLTTLLYDLKKGTSKIIGNSAMQGGSMYALGWRPGKILFFI